MKKPFSSRVALIFEIILTLGICLAVLFNVMARLRLETYRAAETAAGEYQMLVDGYVAAFKTMCLSVQPKLDEDPSLPELDSWLKEQEPMFQEALGEGVFDGFYMTYKGGVARSWHYGEYANYNAKTRPWYIKAQQAKGQVVVVAPYVSYLGRNYLQSDQRKELTIAQRLDENICYALDLKLTSVNDLMALQDKNYPGTVAILFAKDGDVLSSNRDYYYNHNINTTDEVISFALQQVIKDQENMPKEEVRLKLARIDNEYRLVYTMVSKNGLSGSIMYPFWEVFQRNLLAPILLALLLIALELAFYLSNHRKVKQLETTGQWREIILQSIAYHYEVVLAGNLTEDNYQVIKSSTALPFSKNSTLTAQLGKENMLVADSYKVFLLEALTPDNIKKKLSEAIDYGFTVLFKDQHWYSIKVIRSLDYEETGAYFICLEKADEQMRRQKQLEEALRRSKLAEQAKSDFLSRMSHDIRTPLNGVMGMLEIATRLNKEKEVAECLTTAQTSGEFLLSLINNILDLSKLGSHQFKLKEQPVSVQEVDKAVKQVVEPMMQEKGLTFTYRREPDVVRGARVDFVRLTQIFFNLLSNACKYTPKGGKVDFVISKLQEDANVQWIQLLVRDTGIGISKEFQAKLFAPFEQEVDDKHGQQWQGTGLGLAIVREITDKMGGTIELNSELGLGSEFRIKLPLKKCAEPAVTQDLAKESTDACTESLMDKSVLVAEDNDINALVMEKLLERQHIKLVRVKNGAEAVSLLKNKGTAFDLVLMDIMMPVMNGFEATQLIRQLPGIGKIPVIAMTANAFTEDVEKCLAVGMNAHVAKPIDADRLYKVMCKVLAGTKK